MKYGETAFEGGGAVCENPSEYLGHDLFLTQNCRKHSLCIIRSTLEECKK